MDDPRPVPHIAVIIVNWKGAEATIGCLQSLKQSGHPCLRFIVVDNDSGDGSPARIQAAHPQVELLIAPTNLGYAGGFNLGRAAALAAGADYLWLLNNDVAVAPDAAERLVEADREHGPALLSPKILFGSQPNRLWWAGGRFTPDLKSYHIGIGEPDDGRYDRCQSIAWATGCSLFCSAAIARRLGPMDERYFLYLEDVDWSLRAQARGIPIIYVPTARLYHDVSLSATTLQSGQVWYYSWRNYYLLVQQHGGWRQRLGALADLGSRFVKIGTRCLFFPAYRHDAYYQARTRGLLDYVRGRFGARPLVAAAPVPDLQQGVLR